eukprot:Blabericola_migrator_1__195@NODE_1051_length_5591_cov_140_882513_g723_i0_p4_GENE_NODE_1051_length_5591_cov_140_882513_g723_i0NODE_1051_length_5591_cov_140_882513_g723_i0_p4_ORF_typecomplete_len155_score17_54PrgI/PF12666_7/92PrgI/PF12666_7/4_6e03PrgI/PF12666_7/45_NODE_1051_length_5591_cov_140_882513_g723_i043514815
MKQGSMVQNVARWLCLISSLLVLVLGVVHLVDRKPRLHWPNNFIDDDGNAISWRSALFSFTPSVFVDAWTPFVFGLVGSASHFEGVGKGVGFVTKDFMTAAIFQLIMALFAAIAYNGGLGIIFSVVTFTASLMAFITAFTDEDSASLDFVVRRR